MKIAIDAMGGDKAPDTVIQGAWLAKEALNDGTEIVLVGKNDVIHDALSRYEIPEDTFETIHAGEAISMSEHPTKAINQKPESSILVGYQLLKEGKISSFCSAGNTGAMMVGAMFTIKPIEGIMRPVIAGFIPKESQRFGILLDVGANAECKAEVLNQFATVGNIYARHLFSLDEPTIGLINNGEEEGKGTQVTQNVFQLLKQRDDIKFIGNIEGKDILSEKADVMICDGFTGNVILKMGESFYPLLKKRGFVDEFIERFNYENVGASPILGVNGNVIVGHGASSPVAIKNMLLLAAQHANSEISKKIKEAFC